MAIRISSYNVPNNRIIEAHEFAEMAAEGYIDYYSGGSVEHVEQKVSNICSFIGEFTSLLIDKGVMTEQDLIDISSTLYDAEVVEDPGQ